jgi:hypothetical protein
MRKKKKCYFIIDLFFVDIKDLLLFIEFDNKVNLEKKKRNKILQVYCSPPITNKFI